MRTFLILLFLFANCAFADPKEESCIKSPKHITALLIDISDPFDVPGSLAFQSVTKRIINSVPSNGRLDIYKISQNDKELSQPALQVCKPAPANESSIFSGKKYWEKKQQKMFYEPANNYLSSIHKSIVSSDKSPILESIFNISLKSFSDIENKTNGKLIIISDFMQNSDVITFYGKNNDYNKWRSSFDGRSWVREFKNVSIESIVIPRKQNNSLTISGRDFFYQYFVANFKCMSWRDLASSVNVENKNNECN